MKFKEYKGRTTPNAMPIPMPGYGNGYIPDLDLPQGKDGIESAEPPSESSSPRKDGSERE